MGDHQIVPSRRQAGPVGAVREGQLERHVGRVLAATVKYRVWPVLLCHEQPKLPMGHRRKHAKDIEEIRLAGTIRSDEHVQGTEFEPFKYVDRLEPADG